MKLNISYPATGCQKLIEIDDEKKLRPFYEKRLSAEVPADPLGDEWKGYIFRISGGNDKQGFPMKQGVLTAGRVRLLLSKGHSCYRERRDGERRRKSVRGCIVDSNLSVLSLVIVKKGEQEIAGLTDNSIPRRLGPKRASKIRKMFNLSKEDDVRQYVVRRPVKVKEGKKPKTVGPRIQRLVTPLVLQRKRHRLALKRHRLAKKREDAARYAKLLTLRYKEKKARRRSKSASRTESVSSGSGIVEKVKVLSGQKAAEKVDSEVSKGKGGKADKKVKKGSKEAPAEKGKGKAVKKDASGKEAKTAKKAVASKAGAPAKSAKAVAPAKAKAEAPAKAVKADAPAKGAKAEAAKSAKGDAPKAKVGQGKGPASKAPADRPKPAKKEPKKKE